MSYAQGTSVDAFRSRVEIERLLQKHQCSHVGVMHEPGKAIVYFQHKGWEVQMQIPLPMDAPEFGNGNLRYTRLTEAQRRTWLDQRTRERWRQLLLVLKAKFCALEEGVETFEQSFMAHLVIGGQHLGDRLLPLVREAKEKKTQLLLGAGQ